MKEMEFALVGSAAYAARFGETITNLGDIDDDGFSGKTGYIFEKLETNLQKTLTILYVLEKFSTALIPSIS